MRHSTRRITTLMALLVVTSVLAGCGSLSHGIAANGQSAEQLIWPSASDANALRSHGTSPTYANLRNIHAGQDKAAIADLIGYPDFGEGLFGVREWNYLFHLPTDNGYKTCLFKVLFDKHMIARSFYWKPQACGELVNGPKQVKPTTFTLSGDTLFAFDSATLSTQGRKKLAQLADKISRHQDEVGSIRVSGYTDFIGSASYNDKLSQQRAQSVVDFLADQGVSADKMRAVGLGERHPVKTDCRSQGLSHDELIACLAPNRRVEISVFGQLTKPASPADTGSKVDA